MLQKKRKIRFEYSSIEPPCAGTWHSLSAYHSCTCLSFAFYDEVYEQLTLPEDFKNVLLSMKAG